MAKGFSRTPKNYSGTQPTSKQIKHLLPAFLQDIQESYKQQPELIVAAWKEVIGEDLAPMAQAVSFTDGMLHVRVKNSTLHSLLSQHERERLLQRLRQRFPTSGIRNIIFRMG